MTKIKKIALEVEGTSVPKDLQPSNLYIAIGHHLSAATYAGREAEYSIAKFRENMVMVAAFCQAASGDDSESILAERERQDHLWGDEFDRKNTANDWHAYIAHYISKAMWEPHGDFAENMVKAAGIAQAAILMVDRHGAPAPRHYEGLPRSGAKDE